jgi:hypothetical protein
MCPPRRNEVAQMSAPDADRLSRRSSCLHEIGEPEGGSEASQGEGARRAAERELDEPGEQSSNCRLAPRPLISRSKRPQPAGRLRARIGIGRPEIQSPSAIYGGFYAV